MKSLFEQFGGTYRKENDYVIPNLEMPDIANFESKRGFNSPQLCCVAI